jgi:hypothetical protein
MAPAPRVVYQSTELDIAQRDEPDTATPDPLEEELTPPEGWRLLDELLDEDELVVSDELEVVEEVVFEAVDDDEDVPGMVAALTPAISPTPASAAAAAPKVRRLSIRIAESLAWIL